MIHGFEYNPVIGKYEYDPMKSFCFNTTELTPMGLVFWEENEEYEDIHWYMKIAKCNNSTSSVTCKPLEEIDQYIDNMFLTRKVMQPIYDLEYVDKHKYDKKPF